MWTLGGPGATMRIMLCPGAAMRTMLCPEAAMRYVYSAVSTDSNYGASRSLPWMQCSPCPLGGTTQVLFHMVVQNYDSGYSATIVCTWGGGSSASVTHMVTDLCLRGRVGRGCMGPPMPLRERSLLPIVGIPKQSAWLAATSRSSSTSCSAKAQPLSL